MTIRVWHLGMPLLLILAGAAFYVTHGTTNSVATTTTTGARRPGAMSAATIQPGALSAAQANVSTLGVSIESYVEDNTPGGRNDPDGNHSDSGYTGMTIAILRSLYDQATPSYDWVNPTDAGFPAGIAHVAPTERTYCAISKVGNVYGWQFGPKGAIKTSTNPASVCRASVAAFGALPPSDYRKQANAACATANAQMKALQTTKTVAVGAASGQALVHRMEIANLAIAKQEYAALSALQPPASVLADHRRALRGMRKWVELQATIVNRIKAGTNPKKAEGAFVSYVFRHYGAVLQAWADAGVRVCAG